MLPKHIVAYDENDGLTMWFKIKNKKLSRSMFGFTFKVVKIDFNGVMTSWLLYDRIYVASKIDSNLNL